MWASPLRRWGAPDSYFIQISGSLSGGQVNHLGIAAALEVKHPVVGPAMLVVADQLPFGVGREGGLTGARQAEEDGGVAVGAPVGTTVHGEHVFLVG